jgi:hypothetical protein
MTNGGKTKQIILFVLKYLALIYIFLVVSFYFHFVSFRGLFLSPFPWLLSFQRFFSYFFLLVFFLFRFYGESHPTEDMSVKNLAYLTSEQALADIANFIPAMNLQV